MKRMMEAGDAKASGHAGLPRKFSLTAEENGSEALGFTCQLRHLFLRLMAKRIVVPVPRPKREKVIRGIW